MSRQCFLNGFKKATCKKSLDNLCCHAMRNVEISANIPILPAGNHISIIRLHKRTII